MRIKTLTRNDTDMIKGIAILFIMLHNLLHWINPSPSENEFVFYNEVIRNFNHMVAVRPFEFFNLFISCFGHFGVQVFIFISGYGLAVSFSNKQRPWGTFMVERLKKLYPLLLTGIVFLVFARILINKQFLLDGELIEIGIKLLFAQTLFPYSGLSVNGPWWFFALIFQLYLLFPAVFSCIKRYNTIGMLALMLVSYVWIYLSQYAVHCPWDVYLLQNAPGHLPEFVFGIWYAMNKDKKISNAVGIIALPVFVLGCFFKLFFPLTFLAVTLLFVWIITPFVAQPDNNKPFRRFLTFFGSISMILFAIHGYFRQPFVDIANRFTHVGITLATAVLFVAFVTTLAFPAKAMYMFLVKAFDKAHAALLKATSRLKPNDRIETIAVRTIQIFLLLLAIHFVCKYNYIPQYVKNQQTIYQNACPINSSDAGAVAETDKEDAFHSIMISGEEYVALMPYTTLPKNYGIVKAELSFDMSSDIENSNSLPLLVFSCEKDKKSLLWTAVKLEPVVTENGWQHVVISKELKISGNPRNTPLKVYLWNRDRQIMKIDNIAVDIHY